MQCCLGITNRLNGGSAYTLFLDYDDVTYYEVFQELMRLQKDWNLGYTYIIDSKGDKKHFQVICPAVFTPYEILGIFWDSKLCDSYYKQSFFRLKEKTLRISEKKDGRNLKLPVLAGLMVMSTHRPYSEPHLEFIKKYFTTSVPINVKLYKSPLEAVKYLTKIGD